MHMNNHKKEKHFSQWFEINFILSLGTQRCRVTCNATEFVEFLHHQAETTRAQILIRNKNISYNIYIFLKLGVQANRNRQITF